MSNVDVVATGIFCAKNVDKATEQGKIGRIGVAAGQCKNLLTEVAKYDNAAGEGSKVVLSTMRNMANNDALLKFAGKAVNFAADNINPLICVSAGIDVLTADDKKSALITNTTALGSMFAVESLMKKHLDDIPKMDCMKGISEKVLKFAEGTKAEGKLPSIIHGVAFVIGSCTAYAAGEKFGHLLTGKSDNEEKNTNSNNETTAQV